MRSRGIVSTVVPAPAACTISSCAWDGQRMFSLAQTHTHTHTSVTLRDRHTFSARSDGLFSIRMRDAPFLAAWATGHTQRCKNETTRSVRARVLTHREDQVIAEP
jgi:hypothetical protein